MTKDQTSQQKNDKKSENAALLMMFIEKRGWKIRALSEKLGRDESYISRVYHGHEDGGRQLLASLRLLKELTEYERTGSSPGARIDGEIAEVKGRLKEIEQRLECLSVAQKEISIPKTTEARVSELVRQRAEKLESEKKPRNADG